MSDSGWIHHSRFHPATQSLSPTRLVFSLHIVKSNNTLTRLARRDLAGDCRVCGALREW